MKSCTAVDGDTVTAEFDQAKDEVKRAGDGRIPAARDVLSSICRDALSNHQSVTSIDLLIDKKDCVDIVWVGVFVSDGVAHNIEDMLQSL